MAFQHQFVTTNAQVLLQMNRLANAHASLRAGYEHHRERRGDYAERDAISPRSDDRGRDRDREQRGSRDDHRDRGRDRNRRKDDRDRRDWSDDRGARSRHRERSSNRDRSPVRIEDSRGSYDSYEDDYIDDDRMDRYRGRDDRSSDERAGEKWVCYTPSRTIILRGLHQDVTEKIIGADLMLLGIPVKDIRLIRRASGVSRGFAFVEFHNVSDAQRWMEHTQGAIILMNQHHASLSYSVTRSSSRGDAASLQRNDWVCVKCLGHNFKRRDYCYNCNLPRKESEKKQASTGEEEIGQNPCNTLIFRGLDALTTEEVLVTALSTASPHPLAPIKNVSIIRDDLNTSRGFGFVEFHSVQASTIVLETLSRLNPPLEVDGKQLVINYSKNSFTTTMAYIQQQQQAQSQYSAESSSSSNPYICWDPATQQYYDYSAYYAQTAATTATSTTATTAGKGTNTTNAAAAVAQAAIQAAQQAKHYQKQVTKQQTASTTAQHETVTVNGVEYPVYPTPDTSQYQYEETSGFYYDPTTQLYYDANSQYYYNSTTGAYMYWDAGHSTYLPAPSGTTNSAGTTVPEDKEKDKKDGKEKTKMAKKIAKDMEKWAKSMNAQKQSVQDVFKPPMGPPPSKAKVESAAADAGFAMLSKAKEDRMMPPPPAAFGKVEAAPDPAAGLVASYGGDSDDDDQDNNTEDSSGPVDESKLVDWTKLACLLCKRQFQSKEILSKHTQVSNLHKQNLEALQKTKSASKDSKLEYRDRAKERRLKYGAPEPPEVKKRGRDDPMPPIMPKEGTRVRV